MKGNVYYSRDRILDLLPSLDGGLFHGARLRLPQLLADVDLLESTYRADGYLDAFVPSPQVAVLEDPPRAVVTVEVFEGERTYVGAIRFDGNVNLETEDLEDALLLETGDPFDPSLLPADTYRIFALCADRGYTYAKVTPETLRTHDSLDVAFHVEEGKIAYLREIRVEGNVDVRPNTIRRELLVHPGDPFGRRRVLESQSRLYRLGLFSNVEFEPESLRAEPDSLDLTVRVVERDARYFGFGVGYGTSDFARVSADWTNRNLFGTARRLQLRAVAARIFSGQRTDYRWDLTYSNPWLFGTRTEGAITLFHDRRDVVNGEVQQGPRAGDRIGRYRLHETGLRGSVAREFSARVRGWTGYNFNYAKATDASDSINTDDLVPDRKRSVDATIERTFRDQLFDPSRGSVLRVSGELAGSFLGGNADFFRHREGVAIYRPSLWSTVLAGRLEVGSIVSLVDSTGIPDYERFRLGGATTVRGYGEQEIGPGNLLILFGLECRFPLFWKFSSALFLDGGNAWPTADDVRWTDFRMSGEGDEVVTSDVRYGLGTGIRLKTPVGSARLDWAHKLKRARLRGGDLEGPWELHLALGQAF